ncbi:hypothetical protein [Campylobacter suis]|uniref:Uncharacterized protein n=1 Tax=Campylobacter suis TaxID=2790657 RepID=A0ABM8Q5U1_9BACT|nr:hypothetical protein [Campylobacter suis]CAD7288281.1 hypothetical protein LMG8286_01249 [Campylobacter suis]
MSSPERDKELETIDRLIKFCERHDKRHKIINNKILPILFRLPMRRLEKFRRDLVNIYGEKG